MLLEVLLSLGLLIFGMAVVGMQIQSGLKMAEMSDLRTRAVMLMDSKYAELSAGVLVPEGLDEEMTGDFGIAYPGFAWRLLIEPTDVEELFQIEMQIWYSDETRREQLDDPEMEVDYEENGMRRVMTAYRLYARPADVDLEADYGIPQEVLDELSGEVPIPGFDPNSIDPRQLSQLDPEILQEFLPMLEQLFGQGADVNSINDLGQELNRPGGPGGRDGRGGREGRDGRRGGRDGRGGDRDGRGGDRGNAFGAEGGPRGEDGQDGGPRRRGENRRGGDRSSDGETRRGNGGR